MAVELRVFGLVDDTHAAPAEFGEDLVVADGRADHDAPILSQTGLLVITRQPANNPIVAAPEPVCTADLSSSRARPCTLWMGGAVVVTLFSRGSHQQAKGAVRGITAVAFPPSYLLR